MPQRKLNIVRHMTPVQGDDAWVDIRTPKYGEIRALYRKYGKSLKDADVETNMEFTAELLQTYIQGWNWVDGENAPLPQIKDQPDVVFDLLQPEIQELSEKIMRGAETQKKE